MVATSLVGAPDKRSAVWHELVVDMCQGSSTCGSALCMHRSSSRANIAAVRGQQRNR